VFEALTAVLTTKYPARHLLVQAKRSIHSEQYL
jgi:hypothetical protein